MRRLLIAAFVVSVLAGPAAAAAPPAKDAGKDEATSTVLMSPVALPVIVDGRLANYIYVTIRLTLAPKANAAKLREKEPFFRDALLRAAYRTPLQRADDHNALDEGKLRAVLLRESAPIAGPGVVTGAKLLRAQPQKFLPKPRPVAAHH